MKKDVKSTTNTTTSTNGYLEVNNPKYLKIGYKKYEIVKQPELYNQSGELYAEICLDDEKINIATKYSQNLQNQAFLHEMIHGIFDKINYHDLKVDEKLVDLFATCLYEIILDNPDIFIMKDI